MARRRDITKAGKIVEHIRDQYALDEKAKQYEAFAKWPDIVGARVAARTRPLYIVEGRLHVQCDGSVWSQELTFRKSEIIAAINDLMGERAVKDIRYKVK